jgi:arylsulfatase A-like enzyme
MKFSLATPILLTLLVAASSPESSARPNVVLIMVDDLDAGSLRSAADAGYMPNLLGTIIREGTTFTDSFVTLSLCCPSRATSLTGQYSHNHGVIRNSGEFGGFDRFDDRSTLATWLQDAGYHTGHVGKYLNGYRDPSYVPPGWDRWQALVDPSAYCMYGYTISDNGNPVTYGTSPAEYQTDVLAARSEGFVQDWHERGDRRPFYLSIAPLAPHVETCRLHRSDIRPAPRHAGSVSLRLPTPPSYNERDMSDKPVWMRSRPLLDRATLQTLYRNRIASLRAVDDLIGRLVARLAGAVRRNGDPLHFGQRIPPGTPPLARQGTPVRGVDPGSAHRATSRGRRAGSIGSSRSQQRPRAYDRRPG